MKTEMWTASKHMPHLQYKMFILLILPCVQGHKVKIIFGTKANDIVGMWAFCVNAANLKQM